MQRCRHTDLDGIIRPGDRQDPFMDTRLAVAQELRSSTIADLLDGHD